MNVRPWLIHKVTRSKRSGEANAKGDPSYGAQEIIKARVEKKNKRVLDDSGKETVTTHIMATLTEDIALDDRFWFPSIAGETADDVADVTEARTPILIERATTKTGGKYLVMVYF